MNVVKRDGRIETADKGKIARCVARACAGLADVDQDLITDEAFAQLFDGIKTGEIDRAAVLAARARIVSEPAYSYVAARLLMHTLYAEAFGHHVSPETLDADYRDAFVRNIELLVTVGRFAPELLSKFDVGRLAEAIRPERDDLLRYYGVQTLYDRYINHVDGRRLEPPQAFWMRVAMGLSLDEADPTLFAIELYDQFSTLQSCPATPTLLNSGKARPQLSSCFVTTIEDSIDGIYGSALHKMARLSKFGGGLGIDITPLRGCNSYIKGTNGFSQGVTPWAKQINDMVYGVNQGGSRKGAGCLYMEPWHIDYLDFLDLRKGTGDERRRCHDLNTASWIPDELHWRVEQNEDWYFFCPSECPDLHSLFGRAFRERYQFYVQEAEAGRLRNWRKMPAKELWKRILVTIKETGHPWLTWKDPSNERYTNKHVGVVNSSQLCCVTGDQRVVTDRGLMTVADLEKEGGRNRVAGREGVHGASPMVRTIKDSPVVCVKTKEGYEHKVTPDHPLWVFGHGWTEARFLKPGDKVELQQTFGLWGDFHNPDLAYICGLMAGDGTYGGDAALIDLWPKDIHLEHEVEEMVARVLADHEELCGSARNATMTPKFAHCPTQRKARLSSTPLRRVLAHYGFTPDTKTTIPEFVWRADYETVSAYLRGLYVTDGTIQAIESCLTTISLPSVNLRLLQDVQILLMNFGIKSTLSDLQKTAGYRSLPDGRGGHADYWCQQSWRLLMTSIRSCRLFEQATQMAEIRGHKQFLENIKREGYRDKTWAVVQSVMPLPNEDVYCLMVDADDRAWTCNGLLTRNTEVFIHTDATKWDDGEVAELGEVAVCSLHSLNAVAFLTEDGRIDWAKLAVATRRVVRAIDNAIDRNYYPIPEARKSNLANRPIGLGIMGWADLLQAKGIPFDSDEAIELADNLQESVSFHAIRASIELARERGVYPNYEGSLWSQGILPIDTYRSFMSEHRDGVWRDSETCNWEVVRAELRKYGIRNSLILANAPTATISGFLGCSEGVGPWSSVLYVYQTLSGNFALFNERFVKSLKGRGLWTPDLVAALQRTNGDLTDLDLPDDIKAVYKHVFAIDQKKLIDGAAARQKWIDQGQSINIYYDGKSMKELSGIYTHAHARGLKSTYYLHGQAASSVQKNTVVAPPGTDANPAESLAICPIDGSCEACQ